MVPSAAAPLSAPQSAATTRRRGGPSSVCRMRVSHRLEPPAAGPVAEASHAFHAGAAADGSGRVLTRRRRPGSGAAPPAPRRNGRAFPPQRNDAERGKRYPARQRRQFGHFESLAKVGIWASYPSKDEALIRRQFQPL